MIAFPHFRPVRSALCLASWLALFSWAPVQAGPVRIVLPTDNDAIFSPDPSRFYMYTDRFFEGVRSKPWTGGQYGYVRNQKRVSGGVIFTRFHEGVDIAPLRRDPSGRALDEIRSIGEGKVVHVSLEAGKSSYGRYVVIEHDWGDGPLFSLYGHLEKVAVTPGNRVAAGSPIGQMGCTGWAGHRNVERSHLHLELNLMLHDRFPQWHDRHYTSPNHHGQFNGLNMVGMDIVALYLGLRENPKMRIADLVAALPAYFKVVVPRVDSDLQLLRWYPWLGKGLTRLSRPAAYEITFSRSGIPLAIEASSSQVTSPQLTWVKSSPHLHALATQGRLTGMGSKAGLSDAGKAYITLLSGRF